MEPEKKQITPELLAQEADNLPRSRREGPHQGVGVLAQNVTTQPVFAWLALWWSGSGTITTTAAEIP